MSMPRDLSGFAAPAGLPEPPEPIDPDVLDDDVSENGSGSTERSRAGTGSNTTATIRSAPAKRRRPSAPKNRPERHRVCVSLTAETHDALRQLASTRDCWKVEVILDGLERWDDELRAAAAKNGSGRRRRRRRGSNPTPYVMDLTSDELTKLDDLAIISAPSRSALVRRLIELEAEYENIGRQKDAPVEDTAVEEAPIEDSALEDTVPVPPG